MVFDRVVVDVVRVAVLLALALAAMVPLRRAAPAARRLVLAAALAGALVMPVASALAPAWRLPSPVAATGLRARALVEALVEGDPAPAAGASAPAGPAASVPGAERPRSRVGWRGAVIAVWALGAHLVLARLALGLVRARALVRRSRPAFAWVAAVARAEQLTGLRADVRTSDAIDGPAVTGVFSPVVLVPRASESWDDERRTAALVHELAHVRQRDCLVQVVAQLAYALHWFDPLAWLVVRRLRLERELAADAAVLGAGARASRYAEDLLAIARAAWGAGGAPTGALGMGGRSDLAARVAAIVSAEGARRALSRAHAAGLVGGAAVLVAAVACSAPVGRVPATAASAAAPSAQAPSASAPSALQPALQKIADEELDRVLAEWRAEAGAILVLDPPTVQNLADAGRSRGAPADVAAQRAYVTGSTLKTFTLAAALDDGVILPDERFDCEQGEWRYQGQVMRDGGGSYGTLTVSEMLAVSTNVGFTKVFDRLGGDRLGRWLRAFHFGAAPPMEGASGGWVPERIEDRSFAGATVAIGESATATPLQVAAAYAALANGGEYVAPTRTRRGGDVRRERLIKPETARQVVGMLEGVVYADRATGKLARVEGARVAGKTGTAAWDRPEGGEGTYASFVGFVPSTSPRFVILVGVEQAKEEEGGGGAIAAPAFARVASRALAMR